jgi:hypothetical protein
VSQTDFTLKRLEAQIDWYDKKSAYNQRMFKSLKLATIALALAIPLCAALSVQAPILGVLGALIALLEALQQLNQYHHNWITYRSTCEALRHEKYLFFGKAGHYASASDPKALLAERIESLVSQEHAKWASAQEQSAKSRNTSGAEH